jgi:hypothetical protein
MHWNQTRIDRDQKATVECGGEYLQGFGRWLEVMIPISKYRAGSDAGFFYFYG